MSGLVRLLPSIVTGPTAAEAGYGICSGIQGSYRIRRRIPRRRTGFGGSTDVVDATASGTVITRSHYHLDTSGLLSFDSGLQLVPDNAALRGRATPGVCGNIRCLARVAFRRRAVQRVRREEKFHALDVPCRRAGALVHVTARDPFCAGRHSNLVSAAVIANRCAGGMQPWKKSSQGSCESLPQGLPTLS